jgi:hypothetical protein
LNFARMCHREREREREIEREREREREGEREGGRERGRKRGRKRGRERGTNDYQHLAVPANLESRPAHKVTSGQSDKLKEVSL